MQKNFDQKIKAFVPYMIIIGVVYLIVPALLLMNAPAVTYIVLIGLLPLTALLCCAHYSMTKGSDFWTCLFAPLCFVITMLLYRLVQTDPLRAFIYLIAYFLCGYLGLTIGDILSNRSGSNRNAPARPERPRPAVRDAYEDEDEVRVSRPAAAQRPRRVNIAPEPVPVRRPSAPPRARRVDLDAVVEEPERFAPADPYEDRSLDQSTTSDDIDAILREIHQRRGD